METNKYSPDNLIDRLESDDAEKNELPPGVNIVSEKDAMNEEKRFNKLAKQRGETDEQIGRLVSKIRDMEEGEVDSQVLKSRESGHVDEKDGLVDKFDDRARQPRDKGQKEKGKLRKIFAWFRREKQRPPG